MPEITMPALSPTMEAGTLARWLKKVGDAVKSGDVLAEIETDKATMEVEAIDEGVLTEIRVADGTEDVKVGTVIAVIAGEGAEPVAAPAETTPAAHTATPAAAPPAPGGGEVAAAMPEVRGYGANPTEDRAIAAAEARTVAAGAEHPPVVSGGGGAVAGRNGHAAPTGARVIASPLARRLAELRGIDLAGLTGSGPGGRIVKADVDAAGAATAPAAAAAAAPEAAPAHPAAGAAVPLPRAGEGSDTGARPSDPAPALAGAGPARQPLNEGAQTAKAAPVPDIPHEAVKLTSMRKVIARRLTESKQTVPHYYLAIDCRLDALLKTRAELNAALGDRGKLSVNDLLIKALALALRQVPDANVSFTGEQLLKFSRADISVAVAIPAGLITPVIVGADGKRPSEIAAEMKTLAAKARDGKLQPHEYQGGTASLSNLGMYGIKQFEAVINPPQGMILAVGAGDRRPWVEGDALVAATVLTATGSFDHRAIDGAVGAELMAAFKALIEAPLAMLA